MGAEDERTDDPTEFRADLEQDDGNSNAERDHVIRYISTLAIPYSASRYLIESLMTLDGTAEFSMQQVTIGKPVTIDVNVVERLKAVLNETVAGNEEQEGRVKDLFHNQWTRRKTPLANVAVHAEAALMGAAYTYSHIDLNVSRYAMVPRQWRPILTLA